MRYSVNWNYINNTLSDAVVKSGNLEALVAELGCHLRGQPGGSVFRGPCPVHRGDGLNFEVRTDGDILPINWRCFSRACHKTGKLKPSLLGLVRGALTGDPDRPASLPNARQYIEKFLVCHGTRPCFRPPAPTVHRASNSLALSREVVRGQLILPSPYFVARGFNPVVLDRFDIGESRKLGRAIVPVFDERGVTCIGFISRSVLPYCSRCRRCHAKTA